MGFLKQMLSARGRKQFNVLMKTVVEGFIAKKEMYRHLRDNHSPSVQTSASSESEIETKGNERTVTKGVEGTVTKGIERTAEIPK